MPISTNHKSIMSPSQMMKRLLKTPGCIINHPEYQGGAGTNKKNKPTARMQMIIYSRPRMLSVSSPISFCIHYHSNLALIIHHPFFTHQQQTDPSIQV
jgi:hypothetical protein